MNLPLQFDIKLVELAAISSSDASDSRTERRKRESIRGGFALAKRGGKPRESVSLVRMQLEKRNTNVQFVNRNNYIIV
jgi:hypothetical protein